MEKREKWQVFLRAYNKRQKTAYRVTDERKALIKRAIELAGDDYRNYNFFNAITRTPDTNRELDRRLMDYICLKENCEKQPELPILNETPIEAPQVVQHNPQRADGDLGLLEKLLARAMEQVMKDDTEERLKNHLVENLTAYAEQFIKDTYGKIERKIETEVVVNGKSEKIDGVVHEKFETVLNFVNANEPVFLVGGAGSGKNVLVKQIADALDLPFYFSNAVTQEYKLTGFIDANGTYHETEFYKAFKNGGLFMLDEMDASIPEVLVVLNSAIANGYFDFPTERVEAHENFRVVGAGNTYGLGADYKYCGRTQLDGATLDRFAVVEIEYDIAIERALAEGDEELVQFARAVRETSYRNGINLIVSYRAIRRLGKMKHIKMSELLKMCLFKEFDRDNLLTLKGALDDKLPYDNKWALALSRLVAGGSE